MRERAIIAGFGGQGLMFMGKLVAKILMDQGFHVTYFPSYGAEVRGGTAHCSVIASSDEIASPIVEAADTLVVMNQPSYERFKSRLAPDGVALVNSSLVEAGDPPQGKPMLEVPATQTASDIGDVRVANMVMMGVYNALRDFVPCDQLIGQMKAAFGESKAAVFDINTAALEAGRAFARQHIPGCQAAS